MDTTLQESGVIQKISWNGQLDLFPITAQAVMNEIGLSPAYGTILYEKDFLGFDPASRGELTPAETAELEFVGSLFASGIPLTFIERMLSDLDAPFSYSIHDCYWNWRTARWRPLPTPAPQEQVVEEFVDECYFENDAFRLVELRDRIEDMLYKMNDRGRIEAE